MPTAVTCRAAPAAGARQFGAQTACPRQPLRALATPRLPPSRRSAPLVVRVLQSDKEQATGSVGAAAASFARLAKFFTKQIAAEYASSGTEGNTKGGQESVYSKLESW